MREISAQNQRNLDIFIAAQVFLLAAPYVYCFCSSIFLQPDRELTCQQTCVLFDQLLAPWAHPLLRPLFVHASSREGDYYLRRTRCNCGNLDWQRGLEARPRGC